MASDIFARIGDIKGESNDAKHKDEIEVLSFAWGVAHAGATGLGPGSAAGKPTFQDLSFVHRIDKASPLLMKACATGTHLKEATISHRKTGSGQQDFMIVKLSDVTVTSVSQSAASNQLETGSESVSLAFGRVEFEYKAQKPDGSFEGSTQFQFDLKANRTF